jgi:hypothetical protein
MGSVSKVFSRRTLGVFEDASASIPLRQLDRAFDAVAIRLGQDPGGSDGARRVQFRRYIASVDQHDPQQLDRLGDVLGALIEEVATSKKDFLVAAAERDGFIFEEGVFRPAGAAKVKDPRIATTAVELRGPGKRARAAATSATVIVDARYAKAQDAIVVRLNTGSTLIIPRRRLPGFERFAPVALRKLEIEAPGNALWFDAPDIGVRLDTLMIAAAGEDVVRSAATQLVGSRKHTHKASSSAANEKLGGRPLKKSRGS